MKQIIKRDGTVEVFSKNKIEDAVYKASLHSEGGADRQIAKEIADKIDKKYDEASVKPSVEDIQDLVEIHLMESNRKDIAKLYILYREKRSELRKKPWVLDELQSSIWKNKYRYNGEDFEGWISRISNKDTRIAKLIRQKKFLFAGRILANRGLFKAGKKVTYSNCYVIEPPGDSIEEIFDTAKKIARTFSYGGGVGIDISKLRPKGARVRNAAKETTGAVSFMDLYSMTTGLIGQKGRRGALMISMDVRHPEIEEFIDVKTDLEKVTKANISVRVTDEFMEAVKNREIFDCVFDVEQSGERIIKSVDAYSLFKKLVKNNWDYAEPGILFWDRINDYNFMSEDENFEFAGVNPCAEEPLPAGGSCLLGSINLSEFVIQPFTAKATFDINKLKSCVRESVTALNDVLDEGMSLHPLQEQRDSVMKYRQIGLGVMGIADMLIKMGIRYGADESLELCDKIASTILNEAVKQSARIAKKFGAFSEYNYSKVASSNFFIENLEDETKEMVKKYGMINSQILTIPPTGSISTMLGISGGIEPIFNISYVRKTESLHEEDVYYKVYTPIVKQYMDAVGLSDEEDLPDFFVTAMNIDYNDRIEMQKVWQKYVDASISSTINIPYETTVEEVYDIYMKAWEAGLKGVTIFRDGCKRTGILTNEKSDKDSEKSEGKVSNAEKSGKLEQHNTTSQDEISLDAEDDTYEEGVNEKFVCPECGYEGIHNTGGCTLCPMCGYSGCN
ncbi:MAG: adenosylcobalamin-dependent ribonucleoside-diphosphate reductase [Clostridioides sp.]|jgi:ribonucleoside-diphosphate reductase alpha chain|nr:adenosylcobalamin-dependent ribonucleoside-diphosphate reductase [Clostridioides sp.]